MKDGSGKCLQVTTPKWLKYIDPLPPTFGLAPVNQNNVYERLWCECLYGILADSSVQDHSTRIINFSLTKQAGGRNGKGGRNVAVQTIQGRRPGGLGGRPPKNL